MESNQQDLKQFLVKAANFCVYQERTQAEVRERLREWQVLGDEAEAIIAYLISENYLNEERFAKTFAGGKFRVKKWGRQKIKHELKLRRLSTYCINVAMAEIDDEEYIETLKELLEKKQRELRTESNPLVKKQKMARYAMSKGYENELIWQIIKQLE